jgi:hypothetical protein
MLGNRRDSVISQGSSLLSSFLGGQFTSITNALSKFTGLSVGSTTRMLGAVAPIIFGVLKKQKNAQALDASGLANMLAGQKQNIASAMPAGLLSMVSSIPGLSGLSDWSREKAGQATAVGREVYDTGRETTSRTATAARSAVAEPETTNRFLKWVAPLVLLGLITWIGVNLLSNRRNPPPANQPPAAQQPQDNLGFVPPDSDIGAVTTSLNSIANDSMQALSKVSDKDTAEAAATKIQEINSRLDSLHRTHSTLSDTDRDSLGRTIETLREKIQPQVDRAMEVPDARPILEQPVNLLMEKFSAFER